MSGKKSGKNKAAKRGGFADAKRFRPGRITDSSGNVYEVVSLAAFHSSFAFGKEIEVEKFDVKDPDEKPKEPDEVDNGSVAIWTSNHPFSLVFDAAPDSDKPEHVFFQATKADGDRKWRAEVPVKGLPQKEISYAIYSPDTKKKIDPSIIIVDPVRSAPFVLRLADRD